MGVILKIALRNMKRRKIRYILTTITLVISVALFGGVMIVSDSFNVMFLDSIDGQLGTADILIRPANNSGGWFVPDTINSEIEDVPHVESIAYRISGFRVSTSSTDSGNQVDNSTLTAVYGLDHLSQDERELGGKPYIIDSVSDEETIETLLEYIDGTNGGRVIVITESLKIKLGQNFSAGDNIWIFPNEGELLGYNPLNTGTWLVYTVVAIIRDLNEARDFDPDNPSQFLMPSQGPSLFANINNTYELVDGTENHIGEYNLGVIGVDNLYEVASVSDKIIENLDALNDGRDWSAMDLKTDSLEMIDTTMVMMRSMFLMFGLIALILSIILIMNIFNIIKKEQEYETGMFQAIGASKAETFKLFLTQGVVMGIIGATIGTIFSYFISDVIFTVTLDTISNLVSAGSFEVSGFDIVLLPTTLILIFIVGLISCIIASLYPSWKASRKPIIECLSPLEEKTKREKHRYTKKIIVLIFGGLIITFGAWLLMSATSPAETPEFGPMGSQQYINVMVGPVIILLGIIWLIALMIRPLNRGFIILFSPYLRKTKLLTKKNILRHPKRTILTFSMIALITSFLIGISVMMDSMREGVNTNVHNIVGSDVRIFTFNTPRSLEADLLTLQGVDDIMGVSHQNARIKIDDDWIGHSSLESQYNISISMNIIDAMKMKDHLSQTVIASPSGMSLNEMMDELEKVNNIIIDDNFAEDYNVKVGDKLPIQFSLGITFANLSAMIDMNYYNAYEDTIIVNMSVITIVDNFEGFSTLNLMGFLSAGKTYNTFVSWTTYQEIASKNLPGGGSDMVLRQMTQTGDPLLDAVQANWFNFSAVEPILNSIGGIEYYTTRMDSYTLTSFNGTIMTLPTPVVGIHTNSTGKLKSDSFFGNNSLVEQKTGYIGSTMEELLNTAENICVVDEIFIKNNPSIGIGDNITIFPQEFILVLVPAGIFPPYVTTAVPYNFSSTTGTEADLTDSDDVYLSYISNQEWLAVNITTSFQTPNIYKAVNVTIETSVNCSVDKLELEAFNTYTNLFEKLGSINNTIEDNNTFIFDLNHYYFDPMNNLKLRIIGHNSTYNSNYNLTIDSLKFGVAKSTHSPINAATWPKFEIVGIIKAPTYYNTEKYNWYAGFETGYDVSGNSVYISYEKARDTVYSDYRGNNYFNDKITSILLHVDNPKNITTIKSALFPSLFMTGGYWSIIDLKSFSLEIRTSVYDWFAWVEKGASDEDVLEEILNYLESKKYLVLFGFTKSFIRSSFRSMIDLIVFITNGLLILAMVIAMIGLTLHSLLSTMARRREIGMLRSIGLSKKGVIRSISGETLIIAFLGIFTGIFAGLIQGTLMVNSMPSTGFITLTLTIPWLTIGILIFATLITTILSSRYPAKWAANLNIIDAVRMR